MLIYNRLLNTLIAQLRFLPRVVNSRSVSCTMVCEDSGTFLI